MTALEKIDRIINTYLDYTREVKLDGEYIMIASSQEFLNTLRKELEEKNIKMQSSKNIYESFDYKDLMIHVFSILKTDSIYVTNIPYHKQKDWID